MSIQAIRKGLKSGKFDKENSDTSQILNELEHMSEKFSELSTRKDKLVDYATLFNMTPPDFSAFSDNQKELEFQQSKWRSLSKFRENVEGWMKGSCSGLDIEDIQSKVPKHPSTPGKIRSHQQDCKLPTLKHLLL